MNEADGNIFIPQTLVDIFDRSSLIDISLVLFGGMLVAALVGYAIRKSPRLFLPERKEEGGQEAYVVSAVLGLLALLMGFTFSLSLSRFEERRELVLVEANAIGTAHLRTSLIEEPWRGQLRETLEDYAQNRLDLSGGIDEELPERLVRNEVLLGQMWAQTSAMVEGQGASPITAQFVGSINEVIDMDTARKNARLAKVPSAVYAVLLVYIMIAALILGYSLVGFWARLAAVVLFLLLSLSMLLIIDIDRPTVGMLREQQAPLKALLLSFDPDRDMEQAIQPYLEMR
ncbi:bestrophin-like domain [Sphingomicrobium aestuariivivum]|uniref:bestrophin-like domain n=1 Tax=Sphingomicrobium aestuariivivum TaxID=1582356 RepID=UPI001FD6D068|nr:hypothetical protein [Sphingomicrobium aestuariivivum]MCJ8190896.1 hypothetical protein [Sphingomicrobium aestuariivivum]